MSKRIISLFLCAVTCLSLFVFSSSAEYMSKNDNMWEYLMHLAVKSSGDIPILSDAIQGVAAFLEHDVCELSSDGYHYGDTLLTQSENHDEYGRYFCRALCKYCNKPFNCYSSDLSAAYDTYVNDLPASGLGSDGFLYWYPKFSYGYVADTYSSSAQYYWFGDTSNENTLTNFNVSVTSGNPVVVIGEYASSGYVSRFKFSAKFTYNDVAPISGYYNYDSTSGRNLPCSGYYLNDQGNKSSFYFGTSQTPQTSSQYFSAGSSFSVSPSYSPSDGRNVTAFHAKVFPFVVKIKPLSGLIDPVGDTTYNINSRPSSIIGDYGIIGDNGSIIKVDNNTIVNETNNTVYNPVTNTTYDMTGWTYDYSTRTYNITTTEDNSVTVTYGDEYVTINEGDTIYNIYYVVDSPVDEPDPPAVCDHSYTSTITTTPTCEAPGLETMTCSKCGHSYTNRLPATGHTWTIKQTVATEYDEDGNVIQQGYTIYKCSVCSTEYKDDAGTGPPNNSVDNGGGGEGLLGKLGNLIGTILEGILGMILAVLSKLMDGLISLAELISEKLTQVVEVILSMFDQIPLLFTGFLDFLTFAFSFMPGDVVLLLTFGIAAVVFIGILKALRR